MGNPVVYFEVLGDDAATLSIVPVTEIPHTVTFVLLADPEGHAIGVVEGE